MFAEDISEDFSEDRRYHFYWVFYSISGYLRNLRGRLLSSEKFSEVFTLWVFTLKPFPVDAPAILVPVSVFLWHPKGYQNRCCFKMQFLDFKTRKCGAPAISVPVRVFPNLISAAQLGTIHRLPCSATPKASRHSNSSVDSLGARTHVCAALEPFLAAKFGRQ